jgi:hypothetical protein
MASWQLQEARARLSEVVKKAAREGRLWNENINLDMLRMSGGGRIRRANSLAGG